MDELFRAVVRQYAANSDDNELAHRVARMVVRSSVGLEEKSFEEQIKEYVTLKATYSTALGDKIGTAIQALLPKFPTVEAIRWDQYTPGFNDGDPCYFGVNQAQVKFKRAENHDSSQHDEETDEDLGGDRGDGFFYEWDLKDEKLQTLEQIQEFISSIPDDLMQTAFGDGYQITIDRHRIDIEEFNHE